MQGKAKFDNTIFYDVWLVNKNANVHMPIGLPCLKAVAKLAVDKFAVIKFAVDKLAVEKFAVGQKSC